MLAGKKIIKMRTRIKMSNYWISSDFEDDFRNANMAVRCAYLLVVCKPTTAQWKRSECD